MRYRPLGSTGIEVSTFCLGAMMFGAFGNTDHDDSIAIIHKALEAGVNFVDTADVYSGGESETIVGKALAGRRDDVVLATKFHGPMGRDRNQKGNSRRWIVAEVEASLRRLQTDWIDLYQVHRPEPETDIDDTLSALSDLVHAGKIRYAGCSTFPAESIVESHWVAERRGHERFRCEQPPYSILARGIETSVLPTCQRYGMGVIAWSPLNGGWLSGGRHLKDETGRIPPSRRAVMLPRFDPSTEANQRKLGILPQLEELAAQAGTTLIGLSLGFVLAHPAVTAAIIGPRTHEHLDGQLAVADLQLDDATLDRIDELVPPGVDVDRADSGYVTPAEESAWRRRRPLGRR